MSHARPILRFVLWVVSNPRTTLAITLAITALCGALAAARLRLSTDQNKLFSAEVPFFRDYLAFDKQFPENEAIYVMIEAKEGKAPVERWTAAADAVVERLRGNPHVVSVSAKVPLDQLGRQGLLFEEPGKLRQTVEEARRFVPLVKLVGEKPNLLTGLLGPTPLDRLLGGLATQGASAETGGFVRVVGESLQKTVEGGGAGRGPQAGRPNDGVVLPDLQTLDAADPSRLGYYYVPDESDRSRHLLLVRVLPRVNFDSLTAISEAVEDLRAGVRDVAGRFPEFTFGTTGRPALAADEMRTTDEDSTRAEIVALTAVFIGIAFVFRSIWLAIAAELALGVGIGWTFGWATMTVGELNLLSIVFFLALIGIGMDYLVQILSRYRVEVARRADPKLVWVAVFRQVGAPINTACLGAAGAFLVSLFTDFAGAADLGLIAGGGLLLCLLSGYTFLPAILTLFPARPNSAKVTKVARSREHPPRARLFVTPVVWALLLLAGVPFATRTGFNANLLDLQVPHVESVRLVRKLETWSAVVLTKDLSVLRAAREAVKASPEVERTESILTAYDNYTALKEQIPPLPAIEWTDPTAVDANGVKRLADKARNLAKRYEAVDRATADVLNALAEVLGRADPARAAERLSAWQVAFVGQLREMLAQFSPEPLDVSKVPAELRSHLVGDDGTYALYIYPAGDLWKQEHLAKFVEDVESRVRALPAPPTLTGIAHNIHHSTASIRESFYRATFYALGLIFVLVLVDLRKLSDTLLAISVLALGLPMLVALMGLFEVDWNFANFFGLPILIGAGHEYGVFMVHRYRESRENPRRRWDRWDVADTALALCAFVTSSSFGFFFLLANHRGLKSLGLVMALGSACIYLATVLALRPLLLWRLRRRGGRASPA